jgi:hypothetical protein
MTREQDSADATATPTLLLWSRLVQGAAAVVIILLARGPFREGRPHAWNTIAIPLASWFLIDTAFSIAHGVWGNVLLNTATGLMFGIPLLFSRRHFITKH